MTTRADRLVACVVGLVCVAMCWGVGDVFNRPPSTSLGMASTDHPHLPSPLPPPPVIH